MEHPYKIGEKYFIRTITHYYTGKLSAVFEHELVLEHAAWIADAGRFSNALAKGELSEIEPFPDGEIIVGRGALIDACLWSHELPAAVK
jgi:hypothetical protein